MSKYVSTPKPSTHDIAPLKLTSSHKDRNVHVGSSRQTLGLCKLSTYILQDMARTFMCRALRRLFRFDSFPPVSGVLEKGHVKGMLLPRTVGPPITDDERNISSSFCKSLRCMCEKL